MGEREGVMYFKLFSTIEAFDERGLIGKWILTRHGWWCVIRRFDD